MKKSLFLLLLGMTVLSISCKKEETLNKEVQVRIKNASQFDYENILVKTEGGDQNFGTLTSNHSSEYKTFSLARKYAFIKLNIGEAEYVLQPIDNSSADKLESGKYTYEVQLEPESNQLALNLIPD